MTSSCSWSCLSLKQTAVIWYRTLNIVSMFLNAHCRVYFLHTDHSELKNWKLKLGWWWVVVERNVSKDGEEFYLTLSFKTGLSCVVCSVILNNTITEKNKGSLPFSPVRASERGLYIALLCIVAGFVHHQTWSESQNGQGLSFSLR